MCMDISLDYISGFFDGEGCVGIWKTTRKYNGVRYHNFYLRTQLTQTANEHSVAMFEVLGDRFGGAVTKSVSTASRITLNWQLHGEHAVKFLEQIYPHLIIKKNQVAFALAWKATRPPLTRDDKGRIARGAPRRLAFDRDVSKLVKLLKKNSLESCIKNKKLKGVASELDAIFKEKYKNLRTGNQIGD